MFTLQNNQKVKLSVALFAADNTPIAPLPSNVRLDWSLDKPSLGAFDAYGTFTPTGTIGVVNVTCDVMDGNLNRPITTAAGAPIVAQDSITVTGPVPDHAVVVFGPPSPK